MIKNAFYLVKSFIFYTLHIYITYFTLCYNAFYFMLKSLFVLEKRLNKKAKVNFEIYDVTEWTPNNYNAHLTQYFGK